MRPPTPAEMQEYWRSLALGGARLREGLSSVPFWAEGIQTVRRLARESGQNEDLEEAKEWMGLFANQINSRRPETEASNKVATYWLGLLNSEIDSQQDSGASASSTAAAQR